jgi:hypothetical protein
MNEDVLMRYLKEHLLEGKQILTMYVATPLCEKMRLTLPKVGTWSPLGLPRFQSSIAEVKTPHLEVFFIPLERS